MKPTLLSSSLEFQPYDYLDLWEKICLQSLKLPLFFEDVKLGWLLGYLTPVGNNCPKTPLLFISKLSSPAETWRLYLRLVNTFGNFSRHWEQLAWKNPHLCCWTLLASKTKSPLSNCLLGMVPDQANIRAVTRTCVGEFCFSKQETIRTA